MSIDISVCGTRYSLPNEASLDVILEVIKRLASADEISVRLQAGHESRFWAEFAWEEQLFAVVIFGYGNGAIDGDDTLCWCGTNEVTALKKVIKFQPKSLQKELVDLLLKKIAEEQDRLKKIRPKLRRKSPKRS